MTEGSERVRHLRLAIEGYASAQRLHDAGFQRNNWVQLYHVLTYLGVESDAEWLEQFSVQASVVDPSERDDVPEIVLTAPQDPNQGPPRVAEELRWRRFERGDRILTAGIVTGTLEVDRLVHTYGAAFKLRSSVRERGSVVEHVEDLSVLVPPDHPLHGESSPRWRSCGGPTTGQGAPRDGHPRRPARGPRRRVDRHLRTAQRHPPDPHRRWTGRHVHRRAPGPPQGAESRRPSLRAGHRHPHRHRPHRRHAQAVPGRRARPADRRGLVQRLAAGGFRPGRTGRRGRPRRTPG